LPTQTPRFRHRLHESCHLYCRSDALCAGRTLACVTVSGIVTLHYVAAENVIIIKTSTIVFSTLLQFVKYLDLWYLLDVQPLLMTGQSSNLTLFSVRNESKSKILPLTLHCSQINSLTHHVYMRVILHFIRCCKKAIIYNNINRFFEITIGLGFPTF